MEGYTIQEAKEEIKQGFLMYMQKNEKGEYIIPAEKQMPYFLIGPSGIGKTEGSEQA